MSVFVVFLCVAVGALGLTVRWQWKEVSRLCESNNGFGDTQRDLRHKLMKAESERDEAKQRLKDIGEIVRVER